MIQARPVQSLCVDTIWKNFFKKDDQLIVLPTASGKTIIFTLLLKHCLEKFPTLKSQVLVNKVKLVEQTKEKLLYAIDETHTGLVCGSLGEYDSDAAVVVASVQTVSRSTPFVNVLIIDEAHNAADSPTYKNYIKRLKEHNPNLKIVRFTATPYTVKGYIYGEDTPNKTIDFKRTMNQMIEAGHIVKPVFKSTKESFDTSKLRKKRGEFIMKDLESLTADETKVKAQVKDALSKLGDRKKIVWACTCIKHAELVKREILNYEDCAIIHSKLSKKEQRENIDNFEIDDCRHMTSVTMVSEGYDYPAIDAVVGMRPTRSPVLYVQLVGRGLRLFPGKENCLFLDYGEIAENLGHPNDPYVHQTKKKDTEKRCMICPACEVINFLPINKCSDCGFEFYKEERGPRKFLKNLTERADKVEFKRELELDVLRMNIDKNYKAKSGSLCWKVAFTTMRGPIYEYFIIGSRKWKKFELDSRMKGSPKKLKVKRNGKYFNVEEMKWL